MDSATPWQRTRRFFPAILVIGLLLGVANYAQGAWPTLGQSIVQQTLISCVIGLSLTYWVLWLRNRPGRLPEWHAYAALSVGAILIGALGSEVERMANAALFKGTIYQPFNFEGGYLFNVLLSVALGFSFYRFFDPEPASGNVDAGPEYESDEAAADDSDDGTSGAGRFGNEQALTRIPIRAKDQAVELIGADEVLFFEAADNYSFLVDGEGERHFCDYSLAQLEPRLDNRFLRVHRKYLVNQTRIKRVAPHLKGRYALTFGDVKKTTITSGGTYKEAIRPLIRPE